jgi:hypothetical protein
MNNWQEKPKYRQETYSGAALATTNPTWLDPGRRCGKSAANQATGYGPELESL